MCAGIGECGPFGRQVLQYERRGYRAGEVTGQTEEEGEAQIKERFLTLFKRMTQTLSQSKQQRALNKERASDLYCRKLIR